MSYILQALKKSEQERQRGSIPNLQSSQIIAEHPVKQRSIWLRFLVIVLVLNAAALIYWFQPWENKPDTQSASNAHKQPVTLAPAATSQPTPQQLASSTHKASMTGGKSATEKLPAAKVASKATNTSPITAAVIPEPSAPEQQRKTILPSAARGKATVKQDLPHPETIALANPEQASQDVVQSAALFSTASKDTAVAEPRWQKISPSTSQQVIATDQPSAIPASQPEKKTLPKPELQSVHELPANIQQSLPGIAIAAHIYSSDPASRMTIINNKSLREGQVIEAGLVLEEITRKGVILNFQGKRFHLGKLQTWRK